MQLCPNLTNNKYISGIIFLKTCKQVGKMITFKKELLKNGSLNSQQLNNNLEISLKLRRNPETMYRPLTKLELSKSLHLKKENKLGTMYQ